VNLVKTGVRDEDGRTAAHPVPTARKFILIFFLLAVKKERFRGNDVEDFFYARDRH
jgi:hypothetical protein